MMKSHGNIFSRLLALLLLAGLLSACGGGGSAVPRLDAGHDSAADASPEVESNPDRDAAVNDPEPVTDSGSSTDGATDAQPPAVMTLGVGITVLDGYLEPPVIADSDGDGVPDGIDEYPDAPPGLADSYGPSAFHLDHVYSRFPEGDIDAASGDGVTVVIEGRGLDRPVGVPILVFQTGLGDRAVVPQRVDAQTWEAVPPRDTQSVFAVIGDRRSNDVRLQTLSPGTPRIIDPRAPIDAGSTFNLKGANLDNSTLTAWLGEERIDVVAQTATSVQLRIPAAPTSNQLHLAADDEDSNKIVLDIRRAVQIVLDPDLPLPAGAEVRGYWRKQALLVSAQSQPVIDVAAHEPAIVWLNVHRADGSIDYGALAALAWPGETQARASAGTTLSAALYQVLWELPQVEGATWPNIRAALELADGSSEADAFIAGLESWLTSATPFARSTLRAQVMDRVRSNIGLRSAATPTVTSSAGKFSISRVMGFLDGWVDLFTQGSGPPITSFGGYLDDPVAFTVSNYSTGKPQGESNTTLDNADLVAGNNYSQFEVAKHNEYRVIDAQGTLADPICKIQDQDNTVPDKFKNNPPPGITPSDLCMQNSTIMYASFAVYRPEQKTFRAGYAPRNSDLVRRHITAVDDELALGNAGMFLTANRILPIRTPLCGMRTCYIEVLTGGFGLGLDVNLTSDDQNIVKWLRMRSIYERILETVVGQIADLPSNQKVPGCVADLVYQDTRFYEKVGEFSQDLRDRKNNNQVTPINILQDFSDTIGVFLQDLLTGESGNDSIFSCLSVHVPETQLKPLIQAKFDDIVAQTGLNKFQDILKNAMLLGGVLLTPEKFMFKVGYRAEITDIQFAGEASTENVTIDTVDGLFVDAAKTERRKLSVEGTWLANRPIDDLDRAWLPKLRFTDKVGTWVEKQLTDADLGTVVDISLRYLAIDLPAYASQLDKLRSGPVRVSIRFDQASFTEESRFIGYPGDTLTVPAPITIQLRNQPTAWAFEPAGAAAGDDITMIGNSLNLFDGDLTLTLVAEQNGVPDVEVPASKIRSLAAEEIRFTVPDNVTQDQAYRVLANTADGSTATTSTIPFIVTTGSNPTITVADFGKKKDDSLAIILTNIFGDEEARVVLPIGDRYVRSVSIDNLARESQGLAPIFGVDVECLNPGNDSTCTYGISATNARLDNKLSTPKEAFISDAGKIKRGRTNRAQYGIDPP